MLTLYILFNVHLPTLLDKSNSYTKSVPLDFITLLLYFNKKKPKDYQNYVETSNMKEIKTSQFEKGKGRAAIEYFMHY